MQESKVWLVTGSSRGLGRAVAAAAADSGARVMASARRPDQLDELVSAFPGRLETIALDVSNPAAAHRAVRATIDAFGRLDVVVNGASHAQRALIEEMTDDDLRSGLEVDLFGVVHVIRAALPRMRAQRSGVFVQIAPAGPTAGMGAYQAARCAAEGFCEVLASEAGLYGVKVVVVEPGDPARAAEAIVRAVAQDDPPRRVPLP